jgi:hypothetical protein
MMPRKPRKPRVMQPGPLSPIWRAFFETGVNDTKDEEGCDIFICSGHEKLMLKAWEPYREEFLAKWKREGRKGLPWIEKQLRECRMIDG